MKPGTIQIQKEGSTAQINAVDLPAWEANGWTSAAAKAEAKTEQEPKQEPAQVEAPKRGRPKSK